MFRLSVRAARQIPSRSFSQAAVARKDFVQELYVKELKAYKPAPVDANAAASIKGFSAPSAPTPPTALDAAALSKELEAYDAESFVADTPTASASSAHVEASEDNLGADEYLKLLEADVKHEAKH